MTGKHRWIAVTALWLGAAGWSCVGTISDAPGGAGDGPDVEKLCQTGDLPGPHPRMVRLTHAQYDNSVSDMLASR